MRRTVLLAAALLAVPTIAHADTYLTAGIGGKPDVNGTLHDYHADGNTMQVAVGKSWGMFSVEGGLSGFSLDQGGREVSAQASLKLTAPISKIVGIYARAGLEKAWWSYPDNWSSDGSGHLLGAGVEVSPNQLPVGFWLEIERETLSTSGDRGSWKGQIDTAMIGIKVGI